MAERQAGKASHLAGAGKVSGIRGERVKKGKGIRRGAVRLPSAPDPAEMERFKATFHAFGGMALTLQVLHDVDGREFLRTVATWLRLSALKQGLDAHALLDEVEVVLQAKAGGEGKPN